MQLPGYKLRYVLLALALTAPATLVPIGHADAPAGHFEVRGGVVRDTATKLSWQREVPEKAQSAAEAGAYCAALDLDGKGWRLPTIKELHTLVDETRADPAIDVEAFPDTPPTFFWTSSKLTKFPQYAWSVNFGEGGDAWFPAENPQRVRCVR